VNREVIYIRSRSIIPAKLQKIGIGKLVGPYMEEPAHIATVPSQEEKEAAQDDPLYKAWLSKGQKHLIKAFGRRIANVLVALASTLFFLFIASIVASLIWYLTPIFSVNDTLSITERKDLVQGLASVAQAAAVGIAGAVGLIGLFFTWRSLRQARESQEQTQENTLKTLELSEQGQITERFTRAIDQLGATGDEQAPRIEIRLGGIYALERIVRDSPKRDYNTVMEVLTAYVRENASQAATEAEQQAKQPASPGPHRSTRSPQTQAILDVLTQVQLRADIQAILDVLSRTQSRIPEEDRTRLDLYRANLRGANLLEAEFQYAILRYADLRYADLRGANLLEADLLEAGLRHALLIAANLRHALLTGADLQQAKLERVNCQRAILDGADLRQADLKGANLKGANLKGANLKVPT
jgi:uncharacterized protein YjbI with pentapeptide repeats